MPALVDAVQQAGHDTDRVFGLLPRPHTEGIGLLADARRLEPRDHEHRRPVDRDHQHREPLQRHRLVPGEVGQIGAGREQHRVDGELSHSRAGAVDPGGVVGHAPATCTATGCSAASTARFAW